MKKTIFHIIPTLLLLSFLGCKSKQDSAPESIKLDTNTFFVAVNGDDTRTKEQANNPSTPWKTIQKAANNAPSGATVIIGGGTYPEKVVLPISCNGTAAKPTIFKNKVGELPVLDGQNAGVRFTGIFGLKGNQYIIVKGLKTQNGFWTGFYAEESNNITFDSCFTFNTVASGIYVKTTTTLRITRNNVRRACQLPGPEIPGGIGSQECITLAGVNDFVISNNEVWDTDFIGQGGEGIDPKGGSYNGEVSNNYVHDLFRLGIYVDAGSKEAYNIRVFGNRLEKTGGLSIAGELGGHLRDVYLYNNLVVNSRSSGLTFQNIGNGKFSNIYIVNNTFYNNAQTGFAGEIANYSRNTGNSNLVIKNNIFYNKVANSRFSIWHDLASPHAISNNLYFDFKVSNNNANSFNRNNLTDSDILLDPLFNDMDRNDFSLKPNSPSINTGVVITLPNSSTPLFTTDMNGKARGTRNWDVGANEF